MDTTKSMDGSLSQADCRSRVRLEEKITTMWKTIDDLKKKVIEEKELLKKEKSENLKINEEAERLRKHLSMFHLPHCPMHNAPPCPIHSLGNKEQFLNSGFEQEPRHAQGDQQAGIQSYEEFLNNLDIDDQTQEVDVFEEPLLTDEVEANKLMDNFTLMLSQFWQSRQAVGNTSDRALGKIYKDTQNQPLEESSRNIEPELNNL